MSDASFSALSSHLQNVDKPTLWVADENVLHSSTHVCAQPLLSAITNRFDVYLQGHQQGLDISFSDYQFETIDSESLDKIVYRVSKERPVVNHIINEAFRILKVGGQFVIGGEKNEGAKSYIDKAGKLLGNKVRAQKEGSTYTGVITKSIVYCAQDLLDDKNYQNLRISGELSGEPPLSIYSKPGLFGWDKQDQGSQLLMNCAEDYFNQHQYPTSVLDLGCGYGYLTLRTKHWPTVKTRAATDNNAAAVLCTKQNCTAAELNVAVTADDCASHITQAFDCVLCNPPFHQGFSVESSLTEKFLQRASERLSQDGVALFVVNQFIALEKKSQQWFSKIDLLTSDGQFNVWLLKK